MIDYLTCTVSLDKQPRFLRITIGSRGEVVVNYLIFAGKDYSKQIKLPTTLGIEPEPKTPPANHGASNWPDNRLNITAVS